MSLDQKINAYFVLVTPASGTSSPKFSSDEDFAFALQLLRNHIPHEHIRKIQPNEGFPLIASGQLTKKDVFVFNRFEGDFFEQLQQTKSLIVGALCLSTCLLRCQPIPHGTSPVYTAAMRNLQISATGITPKEKDRLRQLIQWMGGHYFADFGRSITHLIANTVKSSKYEQATLHGIPVMHVDWVQRVWERSCVKDIAATDEEFRKYNLPILFGTNVTSTGLTNDKKNEIARIVNENGGTYHACFRSQLVDIVITEKNATQSEKSKAAVRYKKDLLTPEWIFESQQKGYALPVRAYQVKALHASTPTKSDQSLADFTANNNTQMTDISRISSATGVPRANLMSTVNESVYSGDLSMRTPQTVAAASSSIVTNDLQRDVLKKSAIGVHYRLVLGEIDAKQAKKAGTFLDGCCIYLSGFRNEEREKLNRILNLGGAIRYDAVNEKITHIIVGELNDTEYRAWKKDGILIGTHIVQLSWLLESIKLKQPASEVIYRMSLPNAHEPDAPSPSSKRTLRSMNHSFKQPDLPFKKKLFDNADKDSSEIAAAPIAEADVGVASDSETLLDNDEHNLMAQYSQEHLAGATTPLPPPRSAPAAEANDTAAHAKPIASSTQFMTNQTGAEEEITIDYDNLNFMEGSTVYIYRQHFGDEFHTRIAQECIAARGDLVEEDFRDSVDYVVVSFERSLDASKLPIKARHVVNELYVETCLKQNTFVDIEYFYKHVPHTVDARPLVGLTVVLSIYTGLERTFINTLAELMGAQVNKRYLKKERPVLVCPLPEGSKYAGAIKWAYPIVTSDWLLRCASDGEKLPFQAYLVGDSVPDFPIVPTLRERNAPDDSTLATLDNTANSKTLVARPAGDMTPLRYKRIAELVGPVTARKVGTPSSSKRNNASPQTPSSNGLVGPSYDLEIMEEMLADIKDDSQRDCMREIINDIRRNPTPQLERIRRQAVTPTQRGNKWPSPKGVPDFCTTPAFKQRMVDAFERRYRLPITAMKPDTPIEEICRRVIYANAKALGIAVSDDDNDDGDDNPAAQRQTKKARPNAGGSNSATTTPLLRHKPSVAASVAPRSLFTQQTEQQAEQQQQQPEPQPQATSSRKAPEAAAAADGDAYVPCTQSPNASEEISGRDLFGQRIAVFGKSCTIDFDQINFTDTEPLATTSATARTSTGSAANLSSTSSSANNSADVKQITDYLRQETRRQSLKRSNATVTGATMHNNGEPPQQLARHDLELPETEGHFLHAFDSEQFGGTDQMVSWQDPVEFSVERRSKSTLAPQMQHAGTPRFSLSCAVDELREDIIAKIQQLGGEVCTNLVNFDATCTHFLCERPNRGEKNLGCISSGKWVLSLRYVEESHVRGHFVDEELFEWGNCRALNLPALKADEQAIAQAARRWRLELTGTGGGAFNGIRAILRLANRHLDALKTVIKAGKGEIIDASSPYSRKQQAHLATHCFVDMRRNQLSSEDYEFLRDNNVKILTQLYINEYLMNGRDIDCAQFAVRL